jgi:hypothetical protein
VSGARRAGAIGGRRSSLLRAPPASLLRVTSADPIRSGLSRDARLRLVQLYYLATPAFVVSDFVWGANVRVAFLDEYPAARCGYYAVCIACALVTWRLPRLSPLIAYLESSANIALLALGVWVAYLGVIAQAAAETPLVNPFTPETITNLIVSACALGAAHAARVAELRPRPRSALL